MESRNRKLVTVVVLGAALAVLAVAGPAWAGGGNVVYTGPIDQTLVRGFPSKPSIELFVHSKRHGHSGASATITHVNIYDIVLNCDNGKQIGAGEARGNISLVEFVPYHPLPVKGGSFDEPDAKAVTERIQINGTLSKGGVAKGTLAIKEVVGDIQGEEPGEPTEHFGTCRSGTLNWTATPSG